MLCRLVKFMKEEIVNLIVFITRVNRNKLTWPIRYESGFSVPSCV